MPVLLLSGGTNTSLNYRLNSASRSSRILKGRFIILTAFLLSVITDPIHSSIVAKIRISLLCIPTSGADSLPSAWHSVQLRHSVIQSQVVSASSTHSFNRMTPIAMLLAWHHTVLGTNLGTYQLHIIGPFVLTLSSISCMVATVLSPICPPC